MDPELVLAVVGAVLFAAIVWLAALAQDLVRSPARDAEQRAWWALMRPLYTWGVAFAFLWGWSLQEPNPADERVGPHLELLAVVAALVAARALARAIRSARAGTRGVPVATVGLVRPRIVVSREFCGSATPEAVRAACAHEQAHVERRDPLRIWLAQIAADLQWPMPGVSRRFAEWLLALEADRDSAALGRGADAEHLAEAIVTAARLQCGPTPGATAAIAGTGDGIGWRVRRLLADAAAPPGSKPRSRLVRYRWIATLTGALCLGLVHGESVMHALFGVVR